jgi:hypothetical protein
VVIDDTKVFNDKFKEWEDFYNKIGSRTLAQGEQPVASRPPSKASATA